MNKPISIIIDETKQNLVYAINNSGLPACILESMVKDLYRDIRDLSEKQIKMDQQEYENFLVEQENQKKEQNEENKQNEEEV